jgi:hypothetical protein
MLNNKGAKTKPIWVTEVNYGMVSMTSALALSDATQQSFIVRNNVLLAGSGIQRMQWFSWDMYHQGVKLTNFYDWVNLRPAGKSWQVSHSARSARKTSTASPPRLRQQRSSPSPPHR